MKPSSSSSFPLRESSRVIPIRPYGYIRDDTDNDCNDPTSTSTDSNDHNNIATTTAAVNKPPLPLPPPEYAMIELNGELLPPVQFPSFDQCRTVLGDGVDDDSGGSINSSSVVDGNRVELGQLQLLEDDKNNNAPVMILGSHQLKGKVETLKEPFCLMEKVYNNNNNNNNGLPSSSSTSTLVAYQVIGIVKQKFLFADYPKVIMR